jgi:hypothetical protein
VKRVRSIFVYSIRDFPHKIYSAASEWLHRPRLSGLVLLLLLQPRLLLDRHHRLHGLRAVPRRRRLQ